MKQKIDKRKTITISLKPELLEKLRLEAKERGSSISKHIEFVIAKAHIKNKKF